MASVGSVMMRTKEELRTGIEPMEIDNSPRPKNTGLCLHTGQVAVMRMI